MSEQIARFVKGFFKQSYKTFRHVLSISNIYKKKESTLDSLSAVGETIWQVRHSLVEVWNAELQYLAVSLWAIKNT